MKAGISENVEEKENVNLEKAKVKKRYNFFKLLIPEFSKNLQEFTQFA